MTSPRKTGVRLGSFALILAGTFGTAYAIGERLPGHNHSPAPKPSHPHTGAMSPVVPDLTTNRLVLP